VDGKEELSVVVGEILLMLFGSDLKPKIGGSRPISFNTKTKLVKKNVG